MHNIHDNRDNLNHLLYSTKLSYWLKPSTHTYIFCSLLLPLFLVWTQDQVSLGPQGISFLSLQFSSLWWHAIEVSCTHHRHPDLGLTERLTPFSHTQQQVTGAPLSSHKVKQVPLHQILLKVSYLGVQTLLSTQLNSSELEQSSLCQYLYIVI